MSTATTQTVQILSRDKLIDVEGRIIAEGLAITPRADDDRFNISHLPSGRAVLVNRCAEHIEEAAKALTGIPADWTRTSDAIVADQALKDHIVAINQAIPLCWDHCNLSTPAGPSWSVRCNTCDWMWEDEDNEGPLDAKAAKEMARDHECEPEVELSPPGDSNEWFAEWLVSDDGTVGGAR